MKYRFKLLIFILAISLAMQTVSYAYWRDYVDYNCVPVGLKKIKAKWDPKSFWIEVAVEIKMFFETDPADQARECQLEVTKAARLQCDAFFRNEISAAKRCLRVARILYSSESD